jgi:putative ABC transport system permease protein
VERDARLAAVSSIGRGRTAWLRRFVVLVHYPAVGAAVVASAVILGISAAAGPLFESSVSTNVVQLGMRDAGDVLATFSTRGPLADDVVAYRGRMLRRAIGAVPHAGPVTTTLAATGIDVAAGAKVRPVQLVTRDGFAAHVDATTGSGASRVGVWLAESTASVLGVSPGDDVRVSAGRRAIDVPVAAVYRDLFLGEQDPFWAPLASRIYPSGTADAPPPSIVLARAATFLRLTTWLESYGDLSWDVGLARADRDLGYDEASASAAAIRKLVGDVATPETPVGAALQAPSTASPIVDVVRDARATHDSVAGPLRTFSLAGVVAALVGLVAASVYGVRRRRTEIRLLDSLGLSPVALGGRALVESILPITAGAAAGWAIARAGVGAGGPSALIDASAVAASIEQAVGSAVVAVAVLGAATAAAVRTETQPAGTRRGSVAGAPWEVAVLALAAAALYEILSRGTGPAVSPDGTVHIDAFLLLFPVLFIAGCAGLAVRLLVGGLRRASRSAIRWPVPLYLATRRLASSPRIAVLLTTAAALSVGILGYAGTIGRSLDVATFDKARLGIGADVVVGAPGLVDLPTAAGLRATDVVRFLAQTDPARTDVTVLGVDPSSFAHAAFWDPGFADRPLEELLGRLDRAGGTLPALVVGGAVDAVDVGGFRLGVSTVAGVGAFPGQGPGTTVVVSTPALQRALARHGISLGSVGVTYAVWVRGAVARAVDYVEGLGLSSTAVRTTAAFVGAPRFRATSATFLFMELLGVLAAVVALLGVLLYLQARQHARLVSYAVSSRMGLTRRMHRGAVFLEIGAVLLASAVVGSALALVAGALLSPWIDPLPALPPSPSFRPPLGLFAAIAIAVPLTGAIAAIVVQRRTDRANVAEELRYAG